MLKIMRKNVLALSIILLTLPFVIFSIGWLRPLLIVGIIIIVSIIYYRIYKMIWQDDFYIEISKKGVCLLLLIVLGITFIAGIGGYFPQSNDMFMRNAIYRDLILKDWPVFYQDTNRTLVYYFGYWMIPAIITKMFLPFFTEYKIWLIGRMVLYLYTAFFLFIIFLVLCVVVAEKKRLKSITAKDICLIGLVFFLWGTLAIIGVFAEKKLNSCISVLKIKDFSFGALSMEHYAEKVGVTNGNIILLMNVYNQTLTSWLATVTFLATKNKVRLFGILCFSLAFLAPFPMFGIAGMMFLQLIIMFREKKLFLKDVFSIDNILSLIFLIVIVSFYSGGISSHIYIKNIFLMMSFWQGVTATILFVLLSFGIVCFLVQDRATMFLIGIEVLYFIFLFVCMGSGGDFSMRGTIPFAFYIMILVIELLMDHSKRYKIRRSIMKVILIGMGIIPILYLRYLVHNSMAYGTCDIEYDILYTLGGVAGDGEYDIINQYTRLNPSEMFFYKYLAKGTYSIQHPVLEYKNDENETSYVQRVSLSKALLDEFKDEVIISDDEYDRIVSECTDNKVHVFKFEEDEVLPKVDASELIINQEDISIEWTNYRKNYGKNLYAPITSILLSYSGKVEIPPVLVGGGTENASYESGVAVELFDTDHNLISYPLVSSNTKHVIYTNDTEQYVFNLPKPSQSGQYFLKFCFFYTDSNGQEHIVEDKKEYEIDIK